MKTTKRKTKAKPIPAEIFLPPVMVDTTSITDASKRSYFTDRSYLADKDAGYYLVAGRYVWIFYDDYMIIKSAADETRIPYKRYKPLGECIQPRRKPSFSCKNGNCTGLDQKLYYPPTDCVPRTIFGRRVNDFSGKPTPTGQRKWKKKGRPGFWVIEDRVVVTLGDMQYYYKYDGTFVERKKNEQDWALKIGPYAQYPWKIERTKEKVSKVRFNDLVFDAESVHFSGPWVAITQKNPERKNEDDYVVIDRTTGKEEARYQLNRTRLRTHAGGGFYIDKKVKRAPDKPWVWYGGTVVDLQDEDPQKYCFAFKGKKKCVLTPKMAPENRCLPNRKCFLRPQRAEIYNMIETDNFLVKVFPGGVEITFDKKNYYKKTHHFADKRFKRHLHNYLYYKKNRTRYEKKQSRRKSK